MVLVSKGIRVSSRSALVVAILALTALLAACAAPTSSGSTGGQAAAPQAAAPTEAPKQAAATPAPATGVPAAPAAPVATDAAAQAPAAAAGVSFSKDVMPVFEKTCIKCHGGSDGTKGDLSLKTYDDLMKGGKDGPVIAPGKSAASMLVKSIQQGKMPKRGQKLPQDQMALIEKWVDDGAKNN